MKRAAAARVSEVMRGLLAGLLMLLPAGAGETGTKIVEAARKQVGVPLAIHNIGSGAREEDVLFRYPLTGHFRWK